MARLVGIFAVTIALCLLPLAKVVEGTVSDRPVAPISVQSRQFSRAEPATFAMPIQPDAADSLIFNSVLHELLGDESTE